MTLTLALILVGLSLLDSTSFGTLLIPIWLLLTPGRLRSSRMLVYLATVAGFYFGVGLLLVAGAAAAFEQAAAVVANIPEPTLRGAQLAAGIGLIWWSYRLEARAKRAHGRPGRLHRWRERAVSGSGSGSGYGGLLGLAVVATSLELATMVPYLAAIALLANAGLGWGTSAAALAGYCLVMVAPAVLLTVGRVVAHHRVDPLLQRIQAWLTKNSPKLLGWTVGGVGIWVSLNALVNLTIA